MILERCLDSFLGSSISPGSLPDGGGHPPPTLADLLSRPGFPGLCVQPAHPPGGSLFLDLNPQYRDFFWRNS